MDAGALEQVADGCCEVHPSPQTLRIIQVRRRRRRCAPATAPSPPLGLRSRHRAAGGMMPEGNLSSGQGRQLAGWSPHVCVSPLTQNNRSTRPRSLHGQQSADTAAHAFQRTRSELAGSPPEVAVSGGTRLLGGTPRWPEAPGMVALRLPRAPALQDKQRQKEHFTEAGVATAAFRGVDSRDELLAAGEAFGWPLMLKSRTCATPNHRHSPPLFPRIMLRCLPSVLPLAEVRTRDRRYSSSANMQQMPAMAVKGERARGGGGGVGGGGGRAISTDLRLQKAPRGCAALSATICIHNQKTSAPRCGCPGWRTTGGAMPWWGARRPPPPPPSPWAASPKACTRSNGHRMSR